MGSFDLNYAQLYWKSYILSTQKIANWSQKPQWTAGDKYEEVSKKLYGNWVPSTKNNVPSTKYQERNTMEIE